LEYDAIPGDMRNASSYWAGATNGDGNGRITQDSNEAYNLTNENLKFFEHLSRAGLLPETYTNTWAINRGYPALKINSGKGMIAAGFMGNNDSDSNGYQVTVSEIRVRRICSLYLVVSRSEFGGSAYNDSIGVATPLTITAIDKKIDDGVARSGKFQGYRAWGSAVGNCLTGVGGDYSLTETRESCFAEFIIAK
jgi:hypothetical protein